LKIIVFGGAGFIGSALMQLLYSQGHSVACVDNFITGKKENLIQGLPYFDVDITDISNFNKIDFNPDLVVHLAFPTSLCDRNIKHQYEAVTSSGMLNILEYTKKTCNQIIYGSSISVYGVSSDAIITEDTRVNPVLLYGANKYLGELYTKAFHHQFGLQFNIIRISDTFGEKDLRNNAINTFIKAFLSNSPITVTGDGEQLRTYTYVQDMANAIALSTTRITNGTYNVAAKNAISINGLIDKLKYLFQKEIIIQYQHEKKDDRNYIFNCSSFKVTFGDFEVSGLDEGLKRTIEYLKACHEI
jgi:UDP-glucose 4-epimerase